MHDNLEDVPQHNELMWPTLKAIKALGGSAHISEIFSKVSDLENFSEEVQSIPHVTGNETRLGYRLAWARTYLKKGGALENSERGVWSITDLGERLTEDDIPQILKQVRQISKKTSDSDEPSKEETPEDDEDDWKTKLLNSVQQISPDAFERLAQRILRESGFTTVEVTGRSGDGGIDGTGILQLNLVTFPVAFQCKRYKGSVGSPEIRDFRGGIAGRFEKGLLITTGTFSSQAIQESRKAGAMAIDLVDGIRLCDLLKSLKLGVKTKLVESVEIDAEWFSSI